MSRSARRVLAIVIGASVLVFALGGGEMLRQRASSFDEAERLALTIEAEVHEIEAALAIAVGLRLSGPELKARCESIEQELATIDERVVTLEDMGMAYDTLRGSAEAFRIAILAGLRAVETGDPDAARLHEKQVEPAFEAFDEVVDAMVAGYAMESKEARRLADISVLLQIIAAAVIVTFVVSWLRRLTAAELLVRDKDRFISSVSHELRTPLTSVVGFADILRDPTSDLSRAERDDFIRMIAEEGHSVAAVVEDLLVAARAEIGQISIVAEAIDLRAELGPVVEAFPPGAHRRIAVRGSAPVVVGDPIRVRQIIRNLLTNAFRYGGDNVAVELKNAGGGRAILRVLDNGEPIAVEDRERIFETYQRARATKGLAESLGLGLTVSRQLARLMGGDVTYDHVDGLSVFELWLPIATRPIDPGTDERTAVPVNSVAAG